MLLGLTAVIAAFGLLGPISQAFALDDATKTVVLLIGLAVGVDYALFYVIRSRQERRRGLPSHEALELTARTSGCGGAGRRRRPNPAGHGHVVVYWFGCVLLFTAGTVPLQDVEVGVRSCVEESCGRSRPSGLLERRVRHFLPGPLSRPVVHDSLHERLPSPSGFRVPLSPRRPRHPRKPSKGRRSGRYVVSLT